MENDAARLVGEANRIALKIARTEYRKALGLTYIYWSTIALAYSILYVVVYEFNIAALMSSKNGGISSAMIGIIISILYVLIFTVTISRRFGRALRIVGLNRSGEIRRRNSLYIYAGSILLSAIVGMLIALSYVATSTAYTLVSMVLGSLFAFTIVFFLMYKPMIVLGVKLKYYDFLAWITFIISEAVGPLYYVAYYVYPIFWVFAGTLSLLEVIEGG